MFCYNCGKELDEKAVVCTGCGVLVDAPKLTNAVGRVDSVNPVKPVSTVNYKILDVINICVISFVVFVMLLRLLGQLSLGAGSYIYFNILGGGYGNTYGFGSVKGIQATASFASAIFIISSLFAFLSIKNSGLKAIHKAHFIILGLSVFIFFILCLLFGY
jgi:hypothetical protein